MSRSRTLTQSRRLLQFERERGFLVEVDGSTRADNGRVWVSPEKSTGNLAPPVRLPVQIGVPLPDKGNIPVELGYDKTGQKRVLGIDTETLIQQGIDPSFLNPALPKVVRQEQIVNLLCRHDPYHSFMALVYPGITTINGVVVDFSSGGTISLQDEQPSTGEHCYVGVCLVDDGTLDLSASTAQSTASALNTTDLQEVYDGKPAGSRVLWAFVVDGDSDDFSDTNSKDMRDTRP